MWRILAIAVVLLALLAGLIVLRPPGTVIMADRIGLTVSTQSVAYDGVSRWQWSRDGARVATIFDFHQVIEFDFDGVKRQLSQRRRFEFQGYPARISWSPDNERMLVTAWSRGLGPPRFYIVDPQTRAMLWLRPNEQVFELRNAFWTGDQLLGATYDDWTSSFTEEVPRRVLSSIDLSQGEITRRSTKGLPGELTFVFEHANDSKRPEPALSEPTTLLDRRYIYRVITSVGERPRRSATLFDLHTKQSIVVTDDLTMTAEMDAQAAVQDKFVLFYSYASDLKRRARIEIFDLEEKTMLSSTYDYSELALSKKGHGVALTEAKRIKTDDGRSYLVTQPRLARLVGGVVELGDAITFVDHENRRLIPEKLSLSPDGRILIFRGRGQDPIEYYKVDLELGQTR